MVPPHDADAPQQPVSPDTEFRDLNRSGRLVSDYHRLPGILSRMEDAEIRRSAPQLSRIDPDEVRRAHPDIPAVRIAVTGHSTLSALPGLLTAELARHGLLADTHLSDFDSYVFDLLTPDSAFYSARPDLALCVLDPTLVFDEVPVPWRVDDVQAVLDAKLDLLDQLVSRFTSHSDATLVLNTLPLPRRFTAQLLDHRSRARLGARWRTANARLLELSDRHPSVVVIDLDPLLAEGVPAADDRLGTYTSTHLSPELTAAYAREAGHLARAVSGRARKVLAVDLDGTLWGGILGDDGVEGIEVGDGLRGAAFAAFQRAVKQLGSQGVLLAAVSKNDPEPVAEALTGHPGMVLAEKDFVRVSANWRPKHDNLIHVAEDLNLGLDSFVFVDDSPFERGLVRRELPGVAVVDIGAEPALHTASLLRDGWFDQIELSNEDGQRTARYREELDRKDFLATFSSLQDYLEELHVQVRLSEAEDKDVPRLSQLSQRTNQFNVTTVRLSPADVRSRMAAEDTRVLVIRSADRFGDNGVVGAVFLDCGTDEWHIENFLLSCRVFSRGIEQACVSRLLTHAMASGARAVTGAYRPTAKNGKVAEFYPGQGFSVSAEDGVWTRFRHDLTVIAPPPGHITLTTDFGKHV